MTSVLTDCIEIQGVFVSLGANDGRVNILLGLDEEKSFGALQGLCITKDKQVRVVVYPLHDAVLLIDRPRNR